MQRLLVSKRRRHTPLAGYIRQGTTLANPILKDVPCTPVPWERDLLPEHLWLAGLADLFGAAIIHEPFPREGLPASFRSCSTECRLSDLAENADRNPYAPLD